MSRLLTIIIFSCIYFNSLGKDKSIDQKYFDSLLAKGNYREAASFLESLDQETSYYQVMRLKYLSDIGMLAHVINDYESFKETTTVKSDIDINIAMTKIAAEAYYRLGYLEDYLYCITYLSEQLDLCSKSHAKDMAYYLIALSRYHSRLMNNKDATFFAKKAIVLVKDIECRSDSLFVAVFALNAFRNAIDEAPWEQKSKAMALLQKVRNDKYMSLVDRCSLILAIGNVLQDLGVREYGKKERSEIQFEEKKLITEKAMLCYKEVMRNLALHIHTKHDLYGIAAMLTGLQYSYLGDYQSVDHFSRLAIEASVSNHEARQVLHPVSLLMALRLRSWLAHRFGYIDPNNKDFYKELNPLFEKAIGLFIKRQLFSFDKRGKWLSDAYSENPCFEFVSFSLYFADCKVDTYVKARQSYHFYKYAGAKFKLIQRLMEGEFRSQIHAIKGNQLNEFRNVESVLFHQIGFYPNFVTQNNKSNIMPPDSGSELELYLEGFWYDNLTDIRSRLNDKSVYIEFVGTSHYNNYQSIAWLVTLDTSYILEINIAEVDSALNSYDLKKSTIEHSNKHFNNFYKVIWQSIDSILVEKEYQYIFIDPGIYLEQFPFEALIDEEHQRLLEKYTFCRIPDLGIMRLQKLLDREIRDNFLVYQPFYHEFSLPMMEGLSEFLKDNFNVQVIDKVTKIEFLNYLKRAQIFHLGAHGSSQKDNNLASIFTTDQNSPNESFLVLSDDTLYLHELFDLKVNHSLTVLAACQSGSGFVTLGEGKIDFTRSFIQAGSSAVISGLWELDDYATAEILRRFYENLDKGAKVAEALKAAKISFIDSQTDPVYQLPIYWAGLVVVGENEKIMIKRRWIIESTILFMLILTNITAITCRFSFFQRN